MSGSSCVTTGCQTACSNPIQTSSITAATRGTSSPITLAHYVPRITGLGAPVLIRESWYKRGCPLVVGFVAQVQPFYGGPLARAAHFRLSMHLGQRSRWSEKGPIFGGFH